MGPRTLALRGTWSGNTQASVRIGAAASSWSWAAPIAGRRRLAIAFAAAHPLREMAGSLGDRYLRLLEEAGVLGPGLDLEGEPRVCDAAPYQTDNDEPGVSRIGDADTALDPLSSSGVQAAIQSALRAGPVVNTMLAPSSDKDAASEYWKARRSAQAATHRSWSSDTDTPRRTMSTRLSFGVFGRRPCRRVSKTPCQQHHCRRRTRYWP